MLLTYLKAIFVFHFLSIISIPAIAQESSPLPDCYNLADCLLKENSTRAREFIDKGVEVDIQNPHGNTLLMFFADHGYLDIVTTLVNAGADPDIQNDMGQTPLMAASGKGYSDIVNVLLEAGADVTIEDNSGNTAFYYAISTITNNDPYEDPEKLDRLLEIAVTLRKKEREG